MRANDIQIEAGVATLCCGKKSCPTVTLDGDHVILRDDDGGTVRLTRAQADLLPAALQALEHAGP